MSKTLMWVTMQHCADHRDSISNSNINHIDCKSHVLQTLTNDPTMYTLSHQHDEVDTDMAQPSSGKEVLKFPGEKRNKKEEKVGMCSS